MHSHKDQSSNPQCPHRVRHNSAHLTSALLGVRDRRITEALCLPACLAPELVRDSQGNMTESDRGCLKSSSGLCTHTCACTHLQPYARMKKPLKEVIQTVTCVKTLGVTGIMVTRGDDNCGVFDLNHFPRCSVQNALFPPLQCV